jgi:uncharacterized membrane protein YfcA
MSRFIHLCGGRKAFSFFLLFLTSLTLFASQGVAVYSIAWPELSEFWYYIVAIYVGGNVGAKFAHKLPDMKPKKASDEK